MHALPIVPQAWLLWCSVIADDALAEVAGRSYRVLRAEMERPRIQEPRTN